MNASAGTDQPPTLPACVSLCYDGSDLSHLETVFPTLDTLGLRGTFFAHSPSLLDHASDWQAVSNSGHEMASHSLFDAADARGDLPRWTLEMVEEDLRMSRRLLAELFPRQADFSFAYPGPETKCLSVAYDPQPASYVESVRKVFEIARSGIEGLNDQGTCDLGFLGYLSMEGHSAEEMIDAAAEVEARSAWGLFVFGGVGVGSVDSRAHEIFCSWLSDRSDSLPCVCVWRHAIRLRSIREAPEHGIYMKVEGDA